MPPPATESIRYLGVELGPEGASEWADRRRVVHVPRPSVTRIELCRGIAGERPLLQLVFGVAVCILGLALLASMWTGGASGMALRFAAAGVSLLLVGGYVVWSGLRPAYFLRVRTSDDARKLVLASKVNLAQLSDALHAAQERFGYVVEWAIEDARPPTGATSAVGPVSKG